MKTPNAQSGKIIFLALSIFIWHTGRAEFSTDLSDATEPLTDGVPEVAVVRLRGLLNRNLSEAEWRATGEKLAEALLATKQPAEALQLLDDARLREVSSSKFWRAQALVSLHRPQERCRSTSRSRPMKSRHFAQTQCSAPRKCCAR